MGVAPPDQITPDTAAGWDPPGAKDTEVTAVAGGSTPKPHPCCAPPVVKTEKCERRERVGQAPMASAPKHALTNYPSTAETNSLSELAMAQPEDIQPLI